MLPGSGASPTAFRIGLDGPASSIQARAMICGGISSGSSRTKVSAGLARTSVRERTAAAAPPKTTDTRVERRLASSVFHKARRVATLCHWRSRTPKGSPEAEGAAASISSRASGHTAKTPT